MVKYVKFGRFAFAYDDTKRGEKSRGRETPPPPPPPPYRSRDEATVQPSRWAQLGKGILVIVGTLVVMRLGIALGTMSNDASPAAAAASGRELPQTACDRGDVQELVSKEARKIILDQQRGRFVMLAYFGLADPQAILQKFENAQVTFTDVQTVAGSKGMIECRGAMRFDASDTNVGQDILQIPALAWRVNFADGDPTSNDFTVEVDKDSVFDGILVNGKPAPVAPNKSDDSADQRAEAQNERTDDSTSAAQVASDADKAAAVATKAAQDASAAARDAESNKTPSDEDLYAPH